MSDWFDELLNIFSDATGIKEIAPDFEEKEIARLTKEARDSWLKEINMLQGVLNSSSAKERLAAEKRIKELQGLHDDSLKEAEGAFLRESMLGDKEYEEALSAVPVKKEDEGVVYDQEKVSKLVNRARKMPTIPSMPQQERGSPSIERDIKSRRPS